MPESNKRYRIKLKLLAQRTRAIFDAGLVSTAVAAIPITAANIVVVYMQFNINVSHTLARSHTHSLTLTHT